MSVQDVPVTTRPAAFERVNPRFFLGSLNSRFRDFAHVGWLPCWIIRRNLHGAAENTTIHVLVVNPDTSGTETTRAIANNGALRGRAVFTTFANSKTQTSASDLDSDADIEKIAAGKFERRERRYGRRGYSRTAPVARAPGNTYIP
jgi:hypothetical protein